MAPEDLASREMHKRFSAIDAQARFGTDSGDLDQSQPGPSGLQRENIPRPVGASHSGLTAAERDKLEAIRGGALQPREHRGTWPAKPDFKVESVDVSLRPLGASGLTVEERAKLEASRARGENPEQKERGRSK